MMVYYRTVDKFVDTVVLTNIKIISMEQHISIMLIPPVDSLFKMANNTVLRGG